MQRPNVGTNNAFDVLYGRGFGVEDMSSNGLRTAAEGISLPFRLGFSIGKLGIGGLAGVGISLHNLFSDNDIGWGMANRVSFHNRRNMLSWGVGDYNNYNMFGQNIADSPFGAAKIHPKDALIGLRIGQGEQLKTVSFIDILGEIKIDNQFYHIHINFIKKRRRHDTIGGRENWLNFRNPYPNHD